MLNPQYPARPYMMCYITEAPHPADDGWTLAWLALDAFSSTRKVQTGPEAIRALANALPDLSRVQCQRLIIQGQVRLDGAAAKASLRLEGGEQVTIDFPAVLPADIQAEPMPLDIRYEDREILVVNKPAGLVVHPSPGHESGTLVNGILAHCPQLEGVGGKRRPGIVHRLDKDTSGLIVVAKNDRALLFLQQQFKERQVGKRYLALVEGLFRPDEVLIDRIGFIKDTICNNSLLI